MNINFLFYVYIFLAIIFVSCKKRNNDIKIHKIIASFGIHNYRSVEISSDGFYKYANDQLGNYINADSKVESYYYGKLPDTLFNYVSNKFSSTNFFDKKYDKPSIEKDGIGVGYYCIIIYYNNNQRIEVTVSSEKIDKKTEDILNQLFDIHRLIKLPKKINSSYLFETSPKVFPILPKSK